VKEELLLKRHPEREGEMAVRDREGNLDWKEV
jgi:hypothetical protein